MNDPAPTSAQRRDSETAALAKGGRTNFLGFLMRLVARLPFLWFAGRWYGEDALGRFAYAVLVVEFAAQIATVGLKRGLAQLLSSETREGAHPALVWDALILACAVSLPLILLLVLLPGLMFPSSAVDRLDRLLPLVILPIALTDIALAALAYRYDVRSTVRARAVVEPWTISIAAPLLWYVTPRDGLLVSYVLAMVAAWLVAMIALIRSYGRPRGWSPRGARLWQLAKDNLPLAAADAVEWGSRRIDLAILGLFAAPSVVGIYYVAQQVASLPQKLKTSFEPILGPVISRGVAEGRLSDVAAQVAQVGFWVLSAQTAVALALGLPAEAVMGLAGPAYVAGSLALVLLLTAEVAASTAVTSEAALIYLSPRRNLVVSVGMIAAQAVLSAALCWLAVRNGANPMWLTVIVAGTLCAVLLAASMVKARMLSRLTGAMRVHGVRRVLLWATAGAVVLGAGATLLPEWAELALGIPAILALFGWIVWTRGFGPEDRALFKRAGG